MSELNKLGLAQARDALRKGDVTSVELTEACLKEIDGADALGAFVHKTPEIAMERAAAADVRIKAGDAPAMCGLPIGIKDLFCTKGVASQAATASHGCRVVRSASRPTLQPSSSAQGRPAATLSAGTGPPSLDQPCTQSRKPGGWA